MSTKIIAHRGFRSHYPENTLLAFQKALEIGAHGLELDIHYSKDGEIVVFHDFELERMTGQSGNIYDFTYKELKAMAVYQNSLKDNIPTLEEVLTLFLKFEKEKPLPEPRLLNIEFKAGSQFYPDIEEHTLNLCLDYLDKNQLIFSSFDHQALMRLKELDPTILIGALTTASLIEPWHYLEQIHADFYHPHYLTLGGENLTNILKHNVKINTYTVNDPKTAKYLISNHLNAIITDCPDIMLPLLSEEAL